MRANWYVSQAIVPSHAADLIASLPLDLSAAEVIALNAKLPVYKAAAAGLAADVDLVDWWRLQAGTLPILTRAACMAMLIQPSSAGAERCFSILEQFSDQQGSMLNDVKELAVMLRHNNRGSGAV